LTLSASFRLPVRCVRQDEQARRRRPAGASAAPVILIGVRRASVLIGATALFALGCGGNDRAAARPTSTATAAPAATATAAPTATAAKPGLRLKRIGTFDNPVYVTAPPNDRKRIFVVEQGGRVWIVRGGNRLARPFMDISGRIASGGERGLLSLAFAPDYRASGRFYVYFTAKNGDIRIVEYRRGSANRANLRKRRRLLSVSHPASNHNGGLVLFGPDGLLYAGLGDGGGAGDQHGRRGNAQNLGTLLGKIVRLQPTGRPNPQIYAYGLRNPWRFSFAPSGNLVIGDVGQGEVEEISIASKRGQNFGWRVFEGRSRYSPGESAPGHVPPVIQRFHGDGNCSITGGVVVRDPVLSALRGRYVFGDFCRGVIESARIRGTRATDVKATRLHVDSLSSFGVDGRRRAYVTSLGGPVYRLVPR
jgi:glucose/arabinose dehydrogenase